MNQEQWYDAIKSDKKVKFTDEFKEILSKTSSANKFFIESMMSQSYSTSDMHHFIMEILKLIGYYDNPIEKFDDKDLDVIRHFVWDERKFGIMEVVKE